jgi:hypothetical protein
VDRAKQLNEHFRKAFDEDLFAREDDGETETIQFIGDY